MRWREMFQAVVVRPLRQAADALMGATPTPAPAPVEKPAYAEPPVPKADIPVMRMSGIVHGTMPPWQTRTTPPLGSKPHVDPVVARAVKDPSDHEIAQARLTPVDEKTKLAGITLKMIVQDANTGRRYVFKQPDEKTQALERELLAMRLRRAVGQPSVAVAAQSVTLSDGKVVQGYVKPFVESQGALPNDPRQWTEKQKTAVLVDHLRSRVDEHRNN